MKAKGAISWAEMNPKEQLGLMRRVLEEGTVMRRVADSVGTTRQNLTGYCKSHFPELYPKWQQMRREAKTRGEFAGGSRIETGRPRGRPKATKVQQDGSEELPEGVKVGIETVKGLSAVEGWNMVAQWVVDGRHAWEEARRLVKEATSKYLQAEALEKSAQHKFDLALRGEVARQQGEIGPQRANPYVKPQIGEDGSDKLAIMLYEAKQNPLFYPSFLTPAMVN